VPLTEWGITTPPFGHPSFFQRRGVEITKEEYLFCPPFILF